MRIALSTFATATLIASFATAASAQVTQAVGNASAGTVAASTGQECVPASTPAKNASTSLSVDSAISDLVKNNDACTAVSEAFPGLLQNANLKKSSLSLRQIQQYSSGQMSAAALQPLDTKLRSIK